MKKLLDWFLFSNSFTACCATGLCMATERLINNGTPPLFNQLHALVFGSSLLVYNIHHTIKKPPRIPYGLSLLTRHYRACYIALTSAGGVFVIAGLTSVTTDMLIVSILLGLVSLAYSLPVLPFKNKRRIRDFGWLKIVSLAGVWTVATSILPMVYWHRNIAAYPFEIAMRLSFIFSLCIIFDIRDIRADRVGNITTLPQLMGLRNSYMAINISLIVFVVLSLLQCMRYQSWGRVAAAVATAAVTLAVAKYLRKHSSARAYHLLADGVMMVYTLLVLLLY